jgi:hypothetical protein
MRGGGGFVRIGGVQNWLKIVSTQISTILSRVYGTWQPITRVLGPNEWVY